MNRPLVELMEDLVAALEQRDGCDPDAPAWEAALRVRRLEDEIASRLAGVEAAAPSPSLALAGLAGHGRPGVDVAEPVA